MRRSARAVWTGGGKMGQGSLSTDSKVLKDTQYSFSTRFENGIGTNPEELIAAAHAGCFSMALSILLENAGFNSEHLSTDATVTLENPEKKGWVVTGIHLNVQAKVPAISSDQFSQFADNAKANCPISKLLNTTITLSTHLAESQAA